MTPRRSPTRGPVGQATRGTTGTNRLRRNDRYLATLPALRRAADPLVVDLGYGASGVTALELHARLRKHRPDVEVVGLEISPERVARARAQMERVRAGATTFAADARVTFAVGGFEVPLDPGRRPAMIRAMNVLRQYDEDQVAAAWVRSAARLAPGGLLVEGTCDELGRIGSWVDVDTTGTPLRLTISLRLTGLEGAVATGRTHPALVGRRATLRGHQMRGTCRRASSRGIPAATRRSTARGRRAAMRF
jgi:SAM-dependent methyltransferase